MNGTPPRFTLLRLDSPNGFTTARDYSTYSGLMEGEIQEQCQAAFRAHMLNGTDPQVLLQELDELKAYSQTRQTAQGLLASNAAYALSAPCRDYSDLFGYITKAFGAIDSTQFRRCQDTTGKIIAANPINPYLAFKFAPTTIWERLDDAFDMYRNGVLMQMAILFDDDQMVTKMASLSTQEAIAKQAAVYLAKVPYDPLSKVRSWLGTSQPSMREIECRIYHQTHNLDASLDFDVSILSSSSKFSRTSLYKTAPEQSSKTDFCPGVFYIADLELHVEDHCLRHLPGYHSFIKAFPKSIGDGIRKAKGKAQGPTLAKILTNDLLSAGTPGHDILYLYLGENTPGDYLDIIARPDLPKIYMEDLLELSSYPEDKQWGTHNQVLRTLLSTVEPALIEQHAKTDVQLRSAFMVTNDKQYLGRLSENAVESHLVQDLGL